MSYRAPAFLPFGKILIPIFLEFVDGVAALSKQQVLVTGGAGFIGSELVRQLAARGFSVRVVDNLVNGRCENLDGVLGENVELVVADIRDLKSMTSLLRDVDLIFHLACLGVRHSIHSPVENHEVNASATLGLLEIARRTGVKRFVHVSTSEVYGKVLTTKSINEEQPTFPMTVYGASKLAGENYASSFWHTYRYPTVILRPFNAYGPRCHHEGDSGEVIPKFMLRCLAGKPMVIFGDGSHTRDFTYVGDTASGIIAAGISEAAIGQIFNLGTGNEIRIDELANTLREILTRPAAEIVHAAPRPGDVPWLKSDSSKARNLFRFQPSVGLREGLAKIRDWYTSQPKSPEELLQEEVLRNWEDRVVPIHA